MPVWHSFAGCGNVGRALLRLWPQKQTNERRRRRRTMAEQRATPEAATPKAAASGAAATTTQLRVDCKVYF